jgi:hypothetical protein
MSDVQLLVALGIIVAALGVAAFARVMQRRRATQRPLHLAGLPAGLILFTDAGCRRCPAARRVVADGGAPFTEVAYDRDPDGFRATGVTVVPLLVARDRRGTELGRIAGKVAPRALARLITQLDAAGQ